MVKPELVSEQRGVLLKYGCGSRGLSSDSGPCFDLERPQNTLKRLTCMINVNCVYEVEASTSFNADRTLSISSLVMTRGGRSRITVAPARSTMIPLSMRR